MGRAVTAKIRDGMGRDSQNPGQDGTHDKTGQSRKGGSKTGK